MTMENTEKVNFNDALPEDICRYLSVTDRSSRQRCFFKKGLL